MSRHRKKTEVLFTAHEIVQLSGRKLPKAESAAIRSNRVGQTILPVVKSYTQMQYGTCALTTNEAGLCLFGAGLRKWFLPGDKLQIFEA